MIAPSELIINPDGSCFHLHLKPEQLADKIIMVGDPDRVNTVASYFDTKECEVSSREFHTITGSGWNRFSRKGYATGRYHFPTVVKHRPE